jgi:hypothetical protein
MRIDGVRPVDALGHRRRGRHALAGDRAGNRRSGIAARGRTEFLTHRETVASEGDEPQVMVSRRPISTSPHRNFDMEEPSLRTFPVLHIEPGLGPIAGAAGGRN